ncbi:MULTISPECIES: MFS transporter [Brevibacterium]|uniref:MFS transporter n=1 Tax=Brevibacterium casei TaxID=33889 RepID=A0A7T4DL42_9MICO|nr:MFS transporter [Brevibacterium casei]QQB15514.1 MFS transporter [Brevibacterium casei]
MDTTSSTANSMNRGTARSSAGVTTVLAAGILLQAVTMYLTSALMPSAVAEVGGEVYYAWVTTVFIVAGVAATVATPAVLGRLGAHRSYVLGAGAFAVGSAVAAAAPSMEVLLIGRAAQGVGGGLLSGLAFALIRTALPETAWARATAVVSAMFGVGTIVGPTAGGAFAQLDAWRLAFVSVAAAGVILAIAAPLTLPRSQRSVDLTRLPLTSMIILMVAIAALSITSVLPSAWVWVGVVLAMMLLVAFIAVDRRARVGVLPPLAYTRGSLKWIYLALALTTAAPASEAFTPLFGQRLFELAPFAAGFLGATVSIGWSVAAIWSSRAERPAVQARLLVLGPAVTTVAMAVLVVLQIVPLAGPMVIIGWILALILAGVGVGMANPHLSVRAMSSSSNEADGRIAAAAIPIVSQLGQAFAAAIGGIVVNSALPSIAGAAAGLFALFALSALLGLGAVVTARPLDARATIADS